MVNLFPFSKTISHAGSLRPESHSPSKYLCSGRYGWVDEYRSSLLQFGPLQMGKVKPPQSWLLQPSQRRATPKLMLYMMKYKDAWSGHAPMIWGVTPRGPVFLWQPRGCSQVKHITWGHGLSVEMDSFMGGYGIKHEMADYGSGTVGLFGGGCWVYVTWRSSVTIMTCHPLA